MTVRLLHNMSYRTDEADESKPFVPLFPREGLPLGLSRVQQQDSSRLHEHDFVEIVIVEAGEGEHIYAKGKVNVQEGDVFVIQPGQAHQYRNPKGLTLSNLSLLQDPPIPLFEDLAKRSAYQAMFSLDPGLRESEDSRASLRLGFEQLREIMGRVDQYEKALFSEEEHASTKAQIVFLGIVDVLCDLYDAPSQNRRALIHLSQVLSHIDGHFRRELSVSQLAEIAHMSLRNFQRRFQQVTGMSPTQYVNQRRLREAQSLLRSQGTRVTEVAHEVGFQDTAYFSRSFKKLLGMSPKQFQMAQQ